MRAFRSRRQRGAALVTVLFLMLAVLMMSVSSVRAALSAAKSAAAERDRHVARAAAEAALRDGERDIEGAAGPASPRTAIFAAADANADTSAFAERCADGAERTGLCRFMPPPGVPAWQAVDLAGERSVEYGRFSGRSMPLGAGRLPARLPRYLIELLPAPGAPPRYRITAIGFGADPATIVVLQGYYVRTSGSAPGTPATAAGRRLGWRDIPNWPALHRAAS